MVNTEKYWDKYSKTWEFYPRKWCSETPLCSEDCVGIKMALSDPSIHIAGDV